MPTKTILQLRLFANEQLQQILDKDSLFSPWTTRTFDSTWLDSCVTSLIYLGNKKKKTCLNTYNAGTVISCHNRLKRITQLFNRHSVYVNMWVFVLLLSDPCFHAGTLWWMRLSTLIDSLFSFDAAERLLLGAKRCNISPFQWTKDGGTLCAWHVSVRIWLHKKEVIHCQNDRWIFPYGDQ